jgi:hypothetical protein
MVLVDDDLGSGPTRRFATERADELVRIRFVGAVSDAAADELEEVVRERRTRPVDAADPSPTPPDDGPPPSRGRPDEAPGGPPREPGPPDARTAQTRALPATGGSGLLAGLGALGLAGALRLRGRVPAEEQPAE